MAKHLDLEEQEQLAELKHFWNQYGNLITWILILVFGSVAAWNGYQYWQRSQAEQAATLYDEVERAAAAGDAGRLDRAFADIKDKFGKTAYAQQTALLVAKTAIDRGNPDTARTALAWAIQQGKDRGHQSLARLRLSAIQHEARAYDEALATLADGFPVEFEPLAADRKGDILLAQGKKSEAIQQYLKAYKGLSERLDYRRLVQIKLTSLGVDATGAEATATTPTGATGGKP